MKLYIKQKVFSWGDKFRIYDENENDLYYVEGKVFSIGKKLYLYKNDGTELAYIHEKVLSFLPKYFISRGGIDVAEVVKKFTFFRQKYSVENLGWSVSGNFWAHDYKIEDNAKTLASISKRWFSWGDTYEIDIADGVDEVMALCVVLIIDAVIAANNNHTMVSQN